MPFYGRHIIFLSVIVNNILNGSLAMPHVLTGLISRISLVSAVNTFDKGFFKEI